MTTNVSVLVPFSPSDEYRARNWEFLRARWAERYPGFEVVEGAARGEVWCKAEAVADALSRSSGGLLIVADADVWTEGVDDALSALRRRKWAIPHGRVYRLSDEATEASIATGELGGDTAERPYKGVEGGGVVVIQRDAYERVPLDPRFRGWGQEDESWALALRTMFGPAWRGKAPLYHLWHPPQQRLSRAVGSLEGRALRSRYLNASRSRPAMQKLLNEFL